MKKLFGKNLGLTLLETVVAFAVLLVAILYVLQLYATGQGVFLKSQFRTEAVKLGQEILESKRTETSPSALTSCQTVLSGNYYNVNFTTPPPKITAIATYTTPDVSLLVKSLDVEVTGPYSGMTGTVGACDSLGGKLAPGSVTVHLQTWVAQQN